MVDRRDCGVEERRRIRSFTRRSGRITDAQCVALETLSGRYCLNPEIGFDAASVFGRNAPVILEIGFGNGTALVEMATHRPERNYLGIEVHSPGVAHLMLQLRQRELDHVRIYCADAVDVLRHCVPEQSLDGVHLFFPDPWQKRRHHKRRLVTPEFLQLLADKLKSGGYFHAATDWQDYARQMLSVLEGSRYFSNTTAGFSERPDERPLTKFERRGLQQGHGVWDLIFRSVHVHTQSS